MPKLRKRSLKSTGKSLAVMRKGARSKKLKCIACRTEVKASSDAKAILCGLCTVRVMGPDALPPAVLKERKPNKVSLTKSGKPRKKRSPNGTRRTPKYVPTGRPRGWHLRKLWKDPVTGITYSYGKAKTKATKKSSK